MNPNANPNLVTFDRFKDLPLELRLKIWEAALPARIVRFTAAYIQHIIFNVSTTPRDSLTKHLWHSEVAKLGFPRIELLSTCQESRDLVSWLYQDPIRRYPSDAAQPGDSYLQKFHDAPMPAYSWYDSQYATRDQITWRHVPFPSAEGRQRIWYFNYERDVLFVGALEVWLWAPTGGKILGLAHRWLNPDFRLKIKYLALQLDVDMSPGEVVNCQLSTSNLIFFEEFPNLDHLFIVLIPHQYDGSLLPDDSAIDRDELNRIKLEVREVWTAAQHKHSKIWDASKWTVCTFKEMKDMHEARVQ